MNANQFNEYIQNHEVRFYSVLSIGQLRNLIRIAREGQPKGVKHGDCACVVMSGPVYVDKQGEVQAAVQEGRSPYEAHGHRA